MEDRTPRRTRDRVQAATESALHDVRETAESMRETAESVRESARDAVAAIKPRLRGWLHLGTTPVALAAGIVLVVLAPTAPARVAAAIFAATAVLLFGTSAVYHRGS